MTRLAKAFSRGPALVTFVTAGYRLAPQHPFPVALADCIGGLAWVVARIAGVGGDRGAHGEDLGTVGPALERPHDRRGVAGGQEVGQVLDRDAQLADVGNLAVDTHLARVGRRGDRRAR